jgi:hypothetical protein
MTVLLNIKPTNGKIRYPSKFRQELLDLPRLDPYLILKYQDEEFISSVSQNKYLYQKWEDTFILNVENETDIIIV